MEPDHEIQRLQRRLARERSARHAAESIAEKGLRDLYEQQQQLMLLERISTASNLMRSVEEVLALAVSEIGRYTGWLIGHVYLLDESRDDRVLRPTDIWHVSDPAPFAEFRRATIALTFGPGQGLVGQVLSTGRAAWIEDVRIGDSCPRIRAATACGLLSALAFPVLIGVEVVGVLEFYAGCVCSPDETLLKVAAQVGIQLGRVIERRRSEEKLIHDALHDSLTGLPNRSLMLRRLTGLLDCGRDDPQLGFALLFVDLDGFKQVNDSLGHQAGDALLVEVGRRLVAALFPSPGVIPARIGGDEFSVLAPSHDAPGALALARRLQGTLQQPFDIQNQRIYVDCSIGITTGPGNYASAEAVLRDADLAMYRAKSEGVGKIQEFDRGMRLAVLDRRQLEADLRRAVAENEFVLHYQPIFRLDTRELSGFEALVRWKRPGGDLVPPGRFISIAETSGLIVGLGRWVLREACLTARRWQDLVRRTTPLTMSINVSTRQLAEPELMSHVREALEASGVVPSSIRLEITETAAMSGPKRATRMLDPLKRLGVLLSVDDFGTGYSSLSYLQSFPLDILKIDRSFVSRMEETAGQRIIDAIINLAHTLGLQVVAEGIETSFQADYLNWAGCSFGQGYLLGHPLPTDEIERLLCSSLFPPTQVLPSASPVRPLPAASTGSSSWNNTAAVRDDLERPAIPGPVSGAEQGSPPAAPEHERFRTVRSHPPPSAPAPSSGSPGPASACPS